MPRAGLIHDRVVVEAFADEVGLSEITLSALTARCGVRQASLYKHIDDKDAPHRRISIPAANELTNALTCGDALNSLCA